MSEHWWEVSEDQRRLSVGIRRQTDRNRFIIKEWGLVFKGENIQRKYVGLWSLQRNGSS